MEVRIDAKGLYYKELNERVKAALTGGAGKIILDNVNGQRYIGAGLRTGAEIVINGVPGNDLAVFADGLKIIVYGNAQDAIANTMNSGELVIHGNTADLLGYAMRGGRVFVKGSVGYRVGIHMKAYKDIKPVLVIGGKAGDFFGEYMAGGDMVLLGIGLKDGESIAGDYLGTGMHGGAIYVRGTVDSRLLGKEVDIQEPTAEDGRYLEVLVSDYARYFGYNALELMSVPFRKLVPINTRPYGRLYAN